MRLMLMVEMDTHASNRASRDGRMGDVINDVVERVRPEAAYFYARGGRRALMLVVDAPDAQSLPSLAEPFWQELDASVDVFPCMKADELIEGLQRLG
jgi:hypothetical protein